MCSFRVCMRKSELAARSGRPEAETDPTYMSPTVHQSLQVTETWVGDPERIERHHFWLLLIGTLASLFARPRWALVTCWRTLAGNEGGRP